MREMTNTRTRALFAAIALCAAIVSGPLAKANADSYDAMYEAVDYLGKKYGVLVRVDQALMEYGTYAATSGTTIVFNSGYINNPDLLHAHVASDVERGYHPGVNCTPEQLIAAHEFGHVLDNLTGHTTDYELENAIANGFTGEISLYAFESYDEAIAEAFTAVECDVPTPAEQAIYNMLVY